MNIKKQIDDWFEDDTFINRYLWELHDTLNGVRRTENELDRLKDVIDGIDAKVDFLLLADSNQDIKLRALKDLYQLYKDAE